MFKLVKQSKQLLKCQESKRVISQRYLHGDKLTSATDFNKTTDRNLSSAALNVEPSFQNWKFPVQSHTDLVSTTLSQTQIHDLNAIVAYRSKRMILDTLGVGLIGSQTKVSSTMRHFLSLNDGVDSSLVKASVWGRPDEKRSASSAAYLNGVSIHAMDFDDTWHPATHPSGPVLAALMALAETLSHQQVISGADLLTAFNVGIDIQGKLLSCSNAAEKIPTRLHPPAVVGVMGSAAACARLMGLSPKQFKHAMAIAASFSGAPMANAGTKVKPLHCGKAARFGVESALLASCGMEGADDILDNPSGFGSYFADFDPSRLTQSYSGEIDFKLASQDVAIKRIPAHLGMHWAVDATKTVLNRVQEVRGDLNPEVITAIDLEVPHSKYINRCKPKNEHEARHSFQFNICRALIDGDVEPSSFDTVGQADPVLENLLSKVKVVCPPDNVPDFSKMHVQVGITLTDGSMYSAKCLTPYGHWRNPLSPADLEMKFTKNATAASFGPNTIKDIVNTANNLEKLDNITHLVDLVEKHTKLF